MHAERNAETFATRDTGLRPIPHLLRETALRLGDAPAYFERARTGAAAAPGRPAAAAPGHVVATGAADSEPAWIASSWRQLLDQVQRAARALVALGVQPGERVAILGFNRPEWLVMDHAAMMAGAVGVGIYWTSTTPEIEYILQHSAARVLLVEDAAQAAKIEGRRESLPALRQMVAMRGAAMTGAMTWEQFLALGDGAGAAPAEDGAGGARTLAQELEQRLAALSLDDLGALLYTSGTTGHPKAVMLTQRNLAWVGLSTVALIGTGEHDRHLSYLPLAHIAERTLTVIGPAASGQVVYFARSMEQLPQDLRGARPTVFFGVPRVWEKLRAGLSARLAGAHGAKAALLAWSMRVGATFHEAALAGREPGGWQRLRLALARRLVLDKVKGALGLDQARLLYCGAAPIAVDHLRFFLGLDLVVRELYGQSEDTGPTSINLPGATRLGSVGRAIPGLEVRIAADGEILVRAPSVFAGYLGQPEATAEVLREGWLYSGDLGRLDDDGYLYITGRKKDLIITSGGKNISPANLEADLMSCGLIEYAIVVGDGRHFLSALVTLKPEALRAFATAHGLAAGDLHRDPRLLAELQSQIDVVNTHHARVDTVRKFAILPGGISVEGGQLTATMKLRRQAVIEAHRELVEAMYREQ